MQGFVKAMGQTANNKQKLAKFNFSTLNQNNNVLAITTTTQVRDETLKSRFSIKMIDFHASNVESLPTM